MKKMSCVLCILFLVFSSASPSLFQKSHILTDLNRSYQVQDLELGDKILSLIEGENGIRFKKIKITNISRKKYNTVVFIRTETGVLLVGADKKFYNPEKNEFIPAKNLIVEDKLFTIPLNHLSVKEVKVKHLDKPIVLYDISMQDPNIFFICDSSGTAILVHNNWAEAAYSVMEFLFGGGRGGPDTKTLEDCLRAMKTPLAVVGGICIGGKSAYDKYFGKDEDVYRMRIGDVEYQNVTSEMRDYYEREETHQEELERNVLALPEVREQVREENRSITSLRDLRPTFALNARDRKTWNHLIKDAEAGKNIRESAGGSQALHAMVDEIESFVVEQSSSIVAQAVREARQEENRREIRRINSNRSMPQPDPNDDDDDEEKLKKMGYDGAEKSRWQLRRASRRHAKNIEEHKQKLEEYKKDPYAHDNKGTLRNANPEHKPKIIRGRIKEIEGQIAKQTINFNKTKAALEHLEAST
jgi:hypothetical protein